MKVVMKVMIACFVILAMLTACSPSSSTVPTTQGNTTTDKPGESTTTTTGPTTENLNETEPLNLWWVDVDGLFESPWVVTRDLYPDMVFDTLIKYDLGGQSFVNRLASDWSVSDDGLTYTFVIRDNVTWHDGEPLTVDDIVFSFNAMFKASGSGYVSYFSSIEGSAAVLNGEAETLAGVSSNGNKFILKLSQPDSEITRFISKMAILPKHIIESFDPIGLNANAEFWSKPIGSGPYMIDQVSSPNYFTAVPYEGYYGAKPAIQNVTFTSYATGGHEAVAAALISENLDYLYYHEINDIVMAKNIVAQNPNMAYEVIPATYIRSFSFNQTPGTDGEYNDAVQNKNVRQAISLIIDREAIASFYEGQATALTTHVSPSNPDYNTDIPLWERDVDKAVEMLENENFDFSKPIRITYYYDDQTTIDIMELIKQNFADAGITAEVNLAKGDLSVILYEQRNYEILYGAFNPPTYFGHYMKYITGNANNDGLLGTLEYRDEVFKPLYDGYLASNTPEEKRQYLYKLQAAEMDLSVKLPMYVLNQVVIINNAKFYLDPGWHENSNYAFGYGDWGFDQWQILE